MKGLNKVAVVVTKIFEVAHWIGAVAMIVLFGASVFAGTWLGDVFQTGVVFDDNITEYNLKTYGLEIIAKNPDGSYNMTAVAIFAASAMIILAIMAMVFRNAYLILKTAKGETKFSKGDTPFQKDIVRMIREIGIFLIAAAGVAFIVKIVASAVLGAEFCEIDIQSAVFGLLFLCLSSYFDYGKKLEEDVDGLL